MRFLKLTALCACLCACCAMFAAFNAETCLEEGESYSFFCGDTSKNCKVVTVTEGAALKKLTLSDVCGESTVYKELDIEKFLESVNGKIIFTEELSDSTNYYCTADMPYSVELYGTEINLHICVKDDAAVVGSPIIFGGY